MAPVRDELSEKNENVPKILCEMDNHLGNLMNSKFCFYLTKLYLLNVNTKVTAE